MNGIDGIITKGIGGFYYVSDDNGNITECRARGKFRKDGITPLVGDKAVVDTENNEGYIVDIKQRKNSLIRPANRMLHQMGTYSREADWLSRAWY